jgi:hypothetical protein
LLNGLQFSGKALNVSLDQRGPRSRGICADHIVSNGVGTSGLSCAGLLQLYFYGPPCGVVSVVSTQRLTALERLDDRLLHLSVDQVALDGDTALVARAAVGLDFPASGCPTRPDRIFAPHLPQ